MTSPVFNVGDIWDFCEAEPALVLEQTESFDDGSNFTERWYRVIDLESGQYDEVTITRFNYLHWRRLA